MVLSRKFFCEQLNEWEIACVSDPGSSARQARRQASPPPGRSARGAAMTRSEAMMRNGCARFSSASDTAAAALDRDQRNDAKQGGDHQIIAR